MKIIAEVGSNWISYSDINLSIAQAKKCGADAIKFQFFTAKELYGSEAYGEHLHQQYLNFNWLSQIKFDCKDSGIEFMCTAFSPSGYEVVDQFVNTHKIASAEITDTSILEKVNSFGKPVYLSTGGASHDEIRHALLHLKNCAVTIMFCVADYPAKIVDFRHLELLRDKFGSGYQYGYSDHSLDVLNIPKIAKNHGCVVIEKHVNFTPHTHTPDSPHSIDAAELELMVKTLRGEEISPLVTDMLTNQEMRRMHKRRYVAIRAIDPGDPLVVGKNIGIFRPRSLRPGLESVSTFRPWDLKDKKAAIHLTMGQPIVMSDIEV